MKYRTKPKVVTGHRVNDLLDGDCLELPIGIVNAVEVGHLSLGEGYIDVRSPDGTRAVAMRGDWIVETAGGHLWACPADEFAKSYELIPG